MHHTCRLLLPGALFALVLSLVTVGTVHATTGCNAVGWDDRHSDVQGCTLYYSAIEWLYEQGIAKGVQDPQYPSKQLYQPDRPINRAEFTKLVLLASGVIDPPAPCSADPFPDVPKKAWFAPYVCAAKQKGIISGFPDGMFKPGININFANGSKILAKTFKLPVDANDAQFDSDQNIWYRPYTMALLGRAITAESIASFDQPITRGEMAEMLFRLETGKNSFVTERDEDSEDLGMGFEPNMVQEKLGFWLSNEPDTPFIFMPTNWTFRGVFSKEFTASGFAFSHVLLMERCFASGLWEHCKPTFADWTINMAVVPMSVTFATDMSAFEKQEKYFGGKKGTCITMGIEGENQEYCIVPLATKKTLVVVRDYIDPGFYMVEGAMSLEKSTAMYDRIRMSMQWL